MALNYRKDIDGLRAVAVLSVLIYHLNIPAKDSIFLSGGFLGVDIFFVISGFLISRIILHEVAANTFSLLRFYERRCRRLLPSLLIVVIATLVAGYFILPATAFQQMAESAIASVAFVSNFYWLSESQVYGANSGLVAPLLHTWSLAIEEQFYLVFPVLFGAILKFRNVVLARQIGLAIVGGLLAAVLLTVVDFSFSFYMLFSRVWELLTGAFIALLIYRDPDIARRIAPRASLVGPTFGLALILWSLATTQLRAGHPGLATVPVVFGTALIILCARPRDPVTRLLSMPVFVGIGLISYALYLWHYPIFAYGRLLALMDPRSIDYIAWIALSGIAAVLSYRFIEGPLGNNGALSRRFALTCIGAGAVGVLALCMTVIDARGFPERATHITALYGPATPDNQALRYDTWTPLYDRMAVYGEDPPTTREMTRRPTNDEATRLWFSDDDNSVKLLVVGDSHGKDMFNVLRQIDDLATEFEVARFGMARTVPDAVLDDLLQAPNFIAADAVVLSFRYREAAMMRLPVLLEALQRVEKLTVLTTGMPEFAVRDPFSLFDLHLRTRGIIEVDALETEAWTARTILTDDPTNLAVRSMASTYDSVLLDKELLLCDAAAKRCAMVTDDGRKVHYDRGHLTLHGAAHLARRSVDIGWLDPLLDALD